MEVVMAVMQLLLQIVDVAVAAQQIYAYYLTH
jgi:hypothetical protein